MNARPGDILLFRVAPYSSLLDKLIGWGQKKIGQAPTELAYCHVALVGPDPLSIIEARWPRIHSVLLDLLTLQKHNPVEIYRVKGITDAQVDMVIRYAREHIGEVYDLAAVFTLGLVQFGHSTVCSQFVWEAFTAADILLCPYEDLTSPDDIAASPKLTRIF